MTRTTSKIITDMGVYVRDTSKCLYAYQDACTDTWLEVNQYDVPPGPKYKMSIGRAGQRQAIAETVCIDLPSLMNTAEFACALMGWSDKQRLHMVICMVGRLSWNK